MGRGRRKRGVGPAPLLALLLLGLGGRRGARSAFGEDMTVEGKNRV